MEGSGLGRRPFRSLGLVLGRFFDGILDVDSSLCSWGWGMVWELIVVANSSNWTAGGRGRGEAELLLLEE